MTAGWALLQREMRLSLRHGADTLAAVLFFVLAGALFPLAIGPAPETLGRIAPGIVWVCALLAALLPLDRLFGADFEDGSLDQLMLAGLTAGGVAAVKALAHWLGTGLPLLLAAGPLAVMLQLDPAAVPVLLAQATAPTVTAPLIAALPALDVFLLSGAAAAVAVLFLLPLRKPEA